MRAKFKHDLLINLESGKYTHGNGFLNMDNRLCSLGVICDLIVQKGRAEWIYNAGNERALFAKYKGERSCHFLPETLAKDLGIHYRIQAALSRIDDSATDYNPAIQFIKTNL